MRTLGPWNLGAAPILLAVTTIRKSGTTEPDAQDPTIREG